MNLQSDGEKYMNGRLLQRIATDADADTDTDTNTDTDTGATFGNGFPCKRAISHRGRR
jgi:hypothetical protein